MPDALTRYQDGTYLDATSGDWDLSDAAFKSREVLLMLEKHNIRPASLCDIGCGAGGILHELQLVLPSTTRFTGYDISPQALEISRQFANDRCRFLLDDPFKDGVSYDVAIAMDVFEHVEDCFAFLRHMKNKAEYKIYHVPLEVHASAALRGVNAWSTAGHLHQFSRETALRTIEHSEQKIIDWWLTGPGDSESITTRTRLAHKVRRPIAAILGKQFASRLLGGYSLLVLAA